MMKQIKPMGCDCSMKISLFISATRKTIPVLLIFSMMVVPILFTGCKPEVKQSDITFAQVPEIPAEISDIAIKNAILSASKEVEENKNSGESWGELGMVYLVHGFRSEGQQAFIEAARLDQGNANWIYLKAICYFPDDLQKGLAELNNAWSLIQKSGTQDEKLAVQRRVAFVHMENGQYEKAEEIFIKILEQFPDNEGALLGLGLIRNLQGEFGEAVQLIKRCDKHPCTRKRAKQALSIAYRGLGDLQAAEREHQTGETLPLDMDWLDPFLKNAAEYRVGLNAMTEEIDLMISQQRLGEARLAINKIKNDYPSSSLGPIFESRIQMQLNDLPGAIVSLKKAVELDADNFQTWIRLGVALGSQGEFEESVECFKKAISLSPTSGQAYFNLGFALLSSDRKTEALESFQEAIQHEPDLPDAYIAVAQIHEQSSNIEQAREYLARALKIAPRDPRALTAMKRISNPDSISNAEELKN